MMHKLRARGTIDDAKVTRGSGATRFLTLTGTGGSGKTRLALEVARDLIGAYPDGTWLVELAPLSDSVLAPQAVAAALSMREQPGRSLTDTLVDNLRKKDLLLVLDNCEHLVEAAARLTNALLAACPKLRILATSREPLGVSGEAIWPVPPLSLPDGASSVEDLTRSEAVRLFVDRARSRLPGFELSGENAGAVARVCRKLDGIPLAIELATARMGALAVEQIAERLETSLGLQTTGSRSSEPRHRTMRATLAWSYELLDEPERELFGRLSVFVGGWTLDAAEKVCKDAGIEEEGRVSNLPVVDLLSALVDKSLVVAEASPGAGMRYRMLEPVRQYGRERLEESGEAERGREIHARYYLKFAGGEDAAERQLNEAPPVAWHERMESERANLRAALNWSLGEDADESAAEVGLRLAVALFWFWQAHRVEGLRYLKRAAFMRSDPAMARWRARALHGAAWIAVYQGDPGASKVLMAQCVPLYREVGDREGVAIGLVHLGTLAVLHHCDDIPLRAVLEELEELKPGLENRGTLAYLLMLEGLVALGRGDLQRSAALHEEALILLREIGDMQGVISCLIHHGGIALARGDYGATTELLSEALRLARETDNKAHIQLCLHGLACVAALKQPIRAARLWGAVEGMKEAYGVHLTPITRSVTGYEGRLAGVRSQLHEEAFAAAWTDGEAMSLERSIEYALSEVETRTMAPRQPGIRESRPILTRRQREVAGLIAHGFTNSLIAEELHLSEHTVIAHVREIRKKLGVHSRASIATWITEEQRW